MQCAEIQQQNLLNEHLCISVKKENTANFKKLLLTKIGGSVGGFGHRNSPHVTNCCVYKISGSLCTCTPEHTV